ncbi:FRG domain-containing protein [Oscillospiraceae bacterium 38-13]
MKQPSSHQIPQDMRLRGSSPIQNVSEYIGRVNQYLQIYPGNVPVYRGEPRIYEKPCVPNLYRGNLLGENRFFEKSLFDAMRQNRLTKEFRYLDNAIDAQHGEFPSRLLDVSYNCLTALYFAVTPYYHKEETLYDEEDGAVYILFVDEMFSPSGKNTNEYYDAIINHDPPWIDQMLFEKNHKFIDHAKMSDRIIAQQGAFILFQGNCLEELPQYMYCGITISGGQKPQIRRELKQLFGIHTGSIYPETVNLVEEMKGKSRFLNTESFSMGNELNYVLKQLEKELDYYLDYAVSQSRAGAPNMEIIMIHIEKIVNSYRRGLIKLHYNTPADAAQEDRAVLERAKKQYCQLVKTFSESVEEYKIGPFSGEQLQELW